MKHAAITLLTVTLLLTLSPARARGGTPPPLPPQAVTQKKMGNRHFEAGRFTEAIGCYTAAIEAAPAYVEALYNRGLTWQKLNLFYKAIVDFDHALTLRPNDPEILYVRGLAYEATGQFPEALADIQSAAEKGNTQAKAHLKRGELKQQAEAMGQKEKTLRRLAQNTAPEKLARTTRTTLQRNAYGGKTTVTVFAKGDPLYDGPEGIYKQTNHYSKNGTLRQSDTFHHALFSTQNNRSETITRFNENGVVTLVEHHLSGQKLGQVTLFHYSEAGALLKSDTVPLSQYQQMALDQG